MDKIISDKELVVGAPIDGTCESPFDAHFGSSNSMSWAQTIVEPLTKVTQNWDGYGGAKPNSESLQASLELLAELRDRLSIQAPYISPTRNGGVLLNWQVGTSELEIQLEGLVHISFVYEIDSREAPISEEFDITHGAPSSFLDSVFQFFGSEHGKQAA